MVISSRFKLPDGIIALSDGNSAVPDGIMPIRDGNNSVLMKKRGIYPLPLSWSIQHKLNESNKAGIDRLLREDDTLLIKRRNYRMS